MSGRIVWWKGGKAGVYNGERHGRSGLALLAEQGTDAIWSRRSTQKRTNSGGEGEG